jgi:hypothetical protein
LEQYLKKNNLIIIYTQSLRLNPNWRGKQSQIELVSKPNKNGFQVFTRVII